MSNGVAVGNSWHYNFYNDKFYNDKLDDVNAENNYWGTDNSTIIAESIYDKSDDPSKGAVDFEPFRHEPVPCAPIPEQPTVVLSFLGVLALAIYGRNYLKDITEQQ